MINDILKSITKEGYIASMNDLKSGVSTKCPYTGNQSAANAWRKGYCLAIDETNDGA